MEQKKISKIILIILAIIFLITGVFYYLAWKKVKNEAASSSTALKQYLLNTDLDKTTLDCLDKITIEGNPMVGIQRIEPSPDKPYADFFYSAYLKSVEETKINNCETTKLVIGQAKDNSDSAYTVYLPKNLPDSNQKKQMFPAELSVFSGEKIDLMIRYKKGKNYNEDARNYDVDKILGWKFDKSYYNNPGDLEKIIKLYNSK